MVEQPLCSQQSREPKPPGIEMPGWLHLSGCGVTMSGFAVTVVSIRVTAGERPLPGLIESAVQSALTLVRAVQPPFMVRIGGQWPNDCKLVFGALSWVAGLTTTSVSVIVGACGVTISGCGVYFGGPMGIKIG